MTLHQRSFELCEVDSPAENSHSSVDDRSGQVKRDSNVIISILLLLLLFLLLLLLL